MATKKKALQAAAGAAGGAEALAIEDVFSTYLYTGNGSAQTITNGIDLTGEGGLTWIKGRNVARDHLLFDTERGAGKYIRTNATGGETTDTSRLSAFNSDGFSLGSNITVNNSAELYASWTLRKAPRFFDVVTYTGNGVAGRAIPHNLGTTVGTIIIKDLTTTWDWQVYHRSVTGYGALNNTNAWSSYTGLWNSQTPTDTEFYLGSDATVNSNGSQYVAYIFAHDPLGPSGDGSDGLIACGSYTGDGTSDGSKFVDLGWEPQWLLVKRSNSTSSWYMVDNMRGIATGGTEPRLQADQADAELATDVLDLRATGFSPKWSFVNTSGSTYIYIAIRRGPMRVPTSGTEVFAVDIDGTSLTNGVAFNSGWPVDWALLRERTNSTDGWYAMSRLQGVGNYLQTNSQGTEASGISNGTFDHMDGWYKVTTASASWMFRRAPNFFDAFAYSGDGVQGRALPHNLGVAPELMIVKRRNDTRQWQVYSAPTGLNYLRLNATDAASGPYTGYWSSAPTDTAINLGSDADVNASGGTYIAYLFASCPGVSKVGTYNGDGTANRVIDCGFTSGARFVMIKATNTAGDWMVFDTARGIVAGNDALLRLNTTTVEVTSFDIVDPAASGFAVTQDGSVPTNETGQSYIYLAIA